MEPIGAALDGGVDYRAWKRAEFGAVVVRLDLELG